MTFDSIDIDWEYLLERLENLLDLGEEYLTLKLAEVQFDPELFATLLAFRWQQENHKGYLNPIVHPDLPNHQDLLAIVRHLAAQRRLTIAPDALDTEALQWTTLRATYSGRVARQFVNDLSGRLQLAKNEKSMEKAD